MILTAGQFRTDATTPGQGVKCGNGYIGKGKKCKLASGGLSSPAAKKNVPKLAKAAQAVGTVGTGVGLFMQYKNALQGNFKDAGRWGAGSMAFNALHGAGQLAEGKATGNKRMVKTAKRQIKSAALVGGLNLALSGDVSRVAGIPKAVSIGYKRAQFKRNKANSKLNTMSNSEYSAAQKAAGNDPSPFRIPKKNIKNIRTKLERKVNQARSTPTTARRATAGLLKGR